MRSRPTARTRGAHEGLVLRLLRDMGPLSRTKISQVTGMSPATITKTVLPMLSAGLLTEAPDAYSGMGRPAVLLNPVDRAVTVVGVQIGVGRYRVGLADAAGTVRAVSTHPFDPSLPFEEVLDGIGDVVEGLLAADERARCIGIGVGAPGPVDADRRRNLVAVNLGWHDVPVSDWLEDRLGLPVVVDHNVHSFAVGEARYGEHDADSLAYVYVRTGVGFGVAGRSDPLCSGPGPGGESYLGHLRVVEGGRRCSCGSTGCLETLVAEPYVEPQLRSLGVATAPHSELMPQLHGLASQGVGAAVRLETEVVEHLAAATATIVNLFTPQLVLLGGMLSSASPAVLAQLDAATRARIFPLLREPLRIEIADGSDDSLIRGAAAVALEVLHYS